MPEQTTTPTTTAGVGRRAPGFKLACTATPGHPESVARLDDYQDRWLILMFYPQDFSLICPTELLAMSARYDEFTESGADILAISTDTVESHERWQAKPKSDGGLGPIRYPLGSDPTGEVSRAYGVYLDSRRVALRGLFIIDPNSVVQMQVIHNLSVGRRTEDVLRVLTALQVGGLCAESWRPDGDLIDAATELRPGSVISHYRIEERIGAGGFATVFRAFDQTLERTVALKVLRSTDKHLPSIRQEARAAAALNHPNVCTVYNIDDHDGIPMIVMEFLEGRSLGDTIAHEPLPVSRALDVAGQIASGMASAHDAGVVHGDLKPANIMLTQGESVKILDFGLAARRQIVGDVDDTISLDWRRSGLPAGTPGYMSPEQTEGRQASSASDVFSFGLIISEMLTGQPVFKDESVLKVLSQVRSIDPGAVAGGVDEPFRSLLQRMLAPDPSVRTITMHQIGAALRQSDQAQS